MRQRSTLNESGGTGISYPPHDVTTRRRPFTVIIFPEIFLFFPECTPLEILLGGRAKKKAKILLVERDPSKNLPSVSRQKRRHARHAPFCLFFLFPSPFFQVKCTRGIGDLCRGGRRRLLRVVKCFQEREDAFTPLNSPEKKNEKRCSFFFSASVRA